MREPSKHQSKNRTRSTAWRRAALASLILASAPAIADDNKTSVRLNPTIQTQAIQDNPFFSPEVKKQKSPVQLASGKDASVIKLRPVGKVIDLTPIGSKPSNHKTGVVVEKTTGQIQDNPLIGLPEFNESGLVGVEVAEPTDRLDEIQAADPPSDVLKIEPLRSLPVPPSMGEMKPIAKTTRALTPISAAASAPIAPPVVSDQTEVMPVPLEKMEPVPMAPVPKPVPLDQISRFTPAPVTVAAPKPEENKPFGISIVDSSVEPVTDARDNRTPIRESNPVFFSLSDDSELATADEKPAIPSNVVATDPVEALTSPDVVPRKMLEPSVKFAPVPALPIDESADKSVAESTPASKENNSDRLSIPSARIDDNDRHGLSVLQEPEQLRSILGASPITNLGSQDAAISNRSRFRPPVAVVAPPIAIQRDAPTVSEMESINSEPQKRMIPAPIVRSAPPPQANPKPHAPAPKVVAPAKNLATLRMTRAQVRSLTVGGQVRRVSVGDKTVCQAFASGPNQLKLIGVGNGVTRLVVWAAPKNGSKLVTRSFEIHVAEAVEATGIGIGSKVGVLNRSIQNTFPNARISVQRYQDHLIVSGQCQSEESAKKIIRMVRKTCLVPVRDEIKIQ